MSAAFLLTMIPVNLMKFVYYPANMHLMLLLCLKLGSTAQYRIQIFHYLVMVNLTSLIIMSGGSVLAFVKSNIYCICRFDLEHTNVKVLWLEMCLDKSISFILAVCYQPPKTNAQSHQQFIDAFSKALNFVLNDPDRIVIVTGDFNDLTLHKPIHLQSTFVRIMYSCGFHLLIQNPTRRNHILDRFLINTPSIAFNSSVLLSRELLAPLSLRA